MNGNTVVKWVYIANLIKYNLECSRKTIALLKTCSITFTY